MSDNTSTMNVPTADQIKALQVLEKSIRTLLSSLGAEAPKKARKSRSKKAEDSSSETEKPKKPMNEKIAAMNVERKAIFEEMKAAWAKSHPTYAAYFSEDCPADLKKTVKDAVKAGTLERPPLYPDALKEHSKRLGERDPAHAAKAEERRRKKEEKDSQKSSEAGSTTSSQHNDAASDASAPAEKKKRGRKAYKDMTAEEKAAADAKKAAKKAEKEGTKKEAAASPSPPPQPPAPTKSAPAPAPAATVEVITGDDDDPETLKPWSFQGKDYFKNDLGYVYEKVSATEPGDYLGQFRTKNKKGFIDTSVPEPEGSE